MNAPEVDRTSADLRLHGMLRLDFTGTSQSETSKAQLAEIETKLASCNAEIHDLQSRLELLHQRRTRLETQKAYLNSLSSVTRRLPNEILLQFFDYASEMNDLTSNSLRTMPALAISAASSRFRQLAYSFPRIWSRLRLNLTLRHLQPFPLLKHYLDASRQTLLTLELGGTNLLPLAPLTAYSILAACSDRWAQLTISNWFIYQNLVTQNDAMHFPALEQLALPNLYMNDPTLLEHFEHASNLRTFAFAEIHMEDRRNGFPWEQLTVLDCAHYNDEVKEIVEICSNLEELRFRWFYHEEEDAEDDPLSGYFVSSVTIPALKVLSLLLGQQSDLSEHERLANVIFMSLTCPSLTSLVIEGGADFNHPWPREEVMAFTFRSSFHLHLTTLSIRQIPVTDDELIVFLQQLPSLLHLTIHDSNRPVSDSGRSSPITSRLMQSLHVPSEIYFPQTLVTKLRTLSLMFHSARAEEYFSDKLFVNMVLSRWNPEDTRNTHSSNSDRRAACLRSVTMRFVNRVLVDGDKEMYLPLRALDQAGMRVVVIANALGGDQIAVIV